MCIEKYYGKQTKILGMDSSGAESAAAAVAGAVIVTCQKCKEW